MTEDYLPDSFSKFIKRLESDVSVTLQSFDKQAVELINTGKGSRSGCILTLQNSAESKARLAWFRDHDLTEFKQWCYVASKLRTERYHMKSSLYPSCTYQFSMGELLWGLCSDNQDIVNWYMKNTFYGEEMYFRPMKFANNPKDHLFRHYQSLLALRGEWSELEKRALQALEPDSKHPKRYLVDERFFLALARGNQPEMEAALEELCSEKVRNQRNPYKNGTSEESGITFFCMSSFATIYAKIAWIHGFQVNIDSPYIPKEWLPIQPLNHYEDPYDFMKDISLKPVLQTG